jgi:hypothetical protein
MRQKKATERKKKGAKYVPNRSARLVKVSEQVPVDAFGCPIFTSISLRTREIKLRMETMSRGFILK